jgi:hypothetical protein
MAAHREAVDIMVNTVIIVNDMKGWNAYLISVSAFYKVHGDHTATGFE